jgi:hypothetical protein
MEDVGDIRLKMNVYLKLGLNVRVKRMKNEK